MLNKIIVMGRLVSDPDFRVTQSGKSNVKFTIACDRNFAPQGQEKQTDFPSVIAWGATAEFINKYFAKGSMIIVEGSLMTSSYNDKKYPDVKHYTTDINASQVYFGESKKPSANTNAAYGATPQAQTAPQGQTSAPAQQGAALAIGNINEFEEILGDGQLPF